MSVAQTNVQLIPEVASFDRHYVYVVTEVGKGPATKVGIANNPRWRLGSLVSGNWRKLTLHAAFITDSRLTSARIERVVTDRFAPLLLGGEWFSVTGDEMVQAIHDAIEELRL
jgi:hypothetical protein